jgi:hypothetical protein
VPESEAILDLGRRLLWLRVVPGGIGVLLAIDDDRLVARLPLQGQVLCSAESRKNSALMLSAGK